MSHYSTPPKPATKDVWKWTITVFKWTELGMKWKVSREMPSRWSVLPMVKITQGSDVALYYKKGEVSSTPHHLQCGLAVLWSKQFSALDSNKRRHLNKLTLLLKIECYKRNDFEIPQSTHWNTGQPYFTVLINSCNLLVCFVIILHKSILRFKGCKVLLVLLCKFGIESVSYFPGYDFPSRNHTGSSPHLLFFNIGQGQTF